MTINYGNKKIKGVYYGTQNTNCLTYIPEDVKVRLDPIAWTQPTLTANGTMGGDSFACSQQAYYTETNGSKQEAWRMFSSGTGDEWQINDVSTSSTYWAKFYNPEVIKIKKLQVVNPSSGVSNNSPAKVVLYGSNDDSTYTEMGVLTDITTTASAVFDLYLTHSDWYKYYKVEVTPRNTAAVAIGRLKITAKTDDYVVVEKGGKVYVPNGYNTTNRVTIANELKQSSKGINSSSDCLAFMNSTGNILDFSIVTKCYTSDTNPAVTYSAWWDKVNNKIYRFEADSTTPKQQLSFPIAIIKFNAQKRITGLKLLKGVSFFGNKLIGLPGVKGLIPWGYNTDYTYANAKLEWNSITTYTITDLGTDTNGVVPIRGFEDHISQSILYYDIKTNKNYADFNFTNHRGATIIGTYTVNSNGTIIDVNLNPVQPEYTVREISRIYNGSTLVYGYKPNTVLLEKSTAGTYTLNLEHSGDYEVTIVGGGGGGAYNASKKFSDGVISGGSGAGFKGVIHLKAGTHTVKVGAGGTSVNPSNQPTAMPGVGSSSSIGNIITAGCANADGTANAGVHGSGNVISKGGVLRYDSSVVKSYTLATNGNDGLEGWNTSVEGAASVISGTTYGAGDKGQNGAMSKGYDGYVKIVAI